MGRTRIKHYKLILGIALCLAALTAEPVVFAEDLSLPTFSSYAGVFLAGDDHDYFVESSLQIPVLRVEQVSVFYRYRETTPFVKGEDGPQAELLYTRYEVEVDFKLCDQVRLISVGGYNSTHLIDRHGVLSAFKLGGGVGSPQRVDGEPFSWFVVAGGYAERQNFDSDWWADLNFDWRLKTFVQDHYRDADYHATLVLAGNLESSNEGDRIHAEYRLGPELQMLSANGNRASAQLCWYRNDNNPFYGSSENGLMLGLNITSSHDDRYVLNAREHRQSGWLPLIWGQYDVGASTSQQITDFDMHVQLLDFTLFHQVITPVIWYESHQDYQSGDHDNIAYSVSLGLQSIVGLNSPLSHGDPLVVGLDFLHRSDHSINPDADRVPANGYLEHESINLLPQLRLQTIGWDSPYRDPTRYDRKNAWLNYVDWRVAAGVSFHSTRNRDKFAGQLGVNWDVATIQGYVIYVRGIGSIGNETPDWLAEIGVARPSMRVFARIEDYGISPSIAGHGSTAVVGFGVNL